MSNDKIAKEKNFCGDYQNQSIKRLKFNQCAFAGAKFNNAAVTGSRFEHCDFIECDMDQGDFEYCDFYDCNITAKAPISIAFDNSNYINCRIYDVSFYSSTFTNTFFDETEFDNVQIKHCTLEGATFQKCEFRNVDLSQLNLDFVDFKFSHFHDCTLPKSQIVYTFGLLQYLMTTKDSVSISDGAKKMTPDDYINNTLPKLLQAYTEMKDSDKMSIYFPLINILLALNHMDEVEKYLNKAIKLSAQIHDLRMIKHYCKLISLCDKFSMKHKRKLYRTICGLFQPCQMPPWQLKNYSRHMGDIKYILLIENNFPMLVFNFVTNIYRENIEKIGILIKDIFQLSSCHNTSPGHDIHIELGRNSPIMISVQFTETIENIARFLNELIILTCYTVSNDELEKMVEYDFSFPEMSNYLDDTRKLKHFIERYQQENLKFTLTDFHVENWPQDYSAKNYLSNFNSHFIAITERN